MISTSVSIAGRSVGADIATPRERQVDDACAAQDSATETQSVGMQPSKLERLRDDPGVLGRFDAR
jgi:hypothetical protein